MKRILVIVIILLTIVGLSIAGFGFWCMGTKSGTRWLMATVGKVADIEIAAVALEGSLLDGVAIKELRVTWEGGTIQADDLSLSIHPSSYWTGSLAIAKLEIGRLVLETVKQESDAVTAVTKGKTAENTLALTPTWLGVTIDQLQITDFIYRRATEPAEETVIANLIAGQYQLIGHRLTAPVFSYHSPYVELDGSFDWELTRPHLVMTAQVYLPQATANSELFNKISVPVNFPAHLELDGDWNNFSGPVRFGASDATGNNVWLSALATGSWRGIRFEGLKGSYLDGAVSGNLDLSWIDAYRMHGDLSVRELNPETLIEATSGKISFDISGELHNPYDDQPLQASIAALLKEGQFRGHSLQGQAAGQWVGQELTYVDVDLSGDGARLIAKGVPAQRVDLDLEVTELSAFRADLAGQASALGWIRWSDNDLSGEIDGQGQDLAWQGVHVSRVNMHARHGVNDDRLDIRLSGRNWRRGTDHLEQLDGEMTGTLADHQLAITARSSAGHVTASATGHYQSGHWLGRLEQLTARETPWGEWSMPQPSTLSWNKGVMSIDKLQLSGDQGALIGIDIEAWNSSEQARASLTWSEFPLDWLQPYAGAVRLSGRSDGKIRYQTNAGSPLSIAGHLTAQGQIEEESFELGFDTLELDLDWNQGGLQFAGALNNGTEVIQGTATSSESLQWRWPLNSLKADLEWRQLELTRLNRYITDGRLEGVSEGRASFTSNDGVVAQISGELAAQGRMLQGERELGPRNLTATLDWSNGIFQIETKVVGARGGTGLLQLTSNQAPALAWPESGTVNLGIRGLSIAVLEPWLPQGVEIAGFFDGQAEGKWKNQKTFDLSGTLQLQDGHIDWSSEEGQIRLPLQNAAADWSWRGEHLSGSLAMNLAEHGRLKGSWQLPWPAHIPGTLDPTGPMQVNLEGQMQAIGILSTLGPWLVQDVRGETTLNIKLLGSWTDPELKGQIAFKNGGAYLPAAGIQLEHINLIGELDGNRLRITQLEVQSGPGSLNGQGELLFDGRSLSRYQFDITGKDFQVVDFPELYVLFSPDLKLSGTLEKLALQGLVTIPVMKIKASNAAPEVLPSKDVIIVTGEEPRQNLEFATDVQVTVKLGEEVTVNSGGLETRLTGGFIVTMGASGEALAHGEVQMDSGTYKAYGTSLQIRQGILIYNRGPINNPELRIFAAREVGDVLAGVQVTGNAEAPVVSLYSRPSMPERDILGYILMGRAVRSESVDSDILMMGAGTLLPNYGNGFSALGITEIDIQGLLSGVGGVKLRRKLAENWEVESTLGVESGIDLFYIFEFE